MSDIQQRASFDFIRYSNCWEDADVLIAGLNSSPGNRILSIASGGDNSLSLLTTDPELVVALDLNPSQLALVELKAAAFKELDYEVMLGFLGFTAEEKSSRTKTYRALRGSLSESAIAFWEEHPEIIEGGMIHVGKFERYFSLFRNKVLPFVHSRKDVAELIAQKSLKEQEEFYRQKWDTWRWRGMFRLFFSRFVMGRLGRDPELFRYVQGSVADRILARTRHALTAISTHDNPYARYILNGSFGDALPHYVRRENFEKIRRNLQALQLLKGTTDDALRTYDVRFDGMNLSDIFEYMTPEETAQIGGRLVDRLQPNGRLVYWNMLAPRSLADAMPDRLCSLDELSGRLLADDRAFFYQALHVDQAR